MIPLPRMPESNTCLLADLFQAQFSLANHYLVSNNPKKAIVVLQQAVRHIDMGSLGSLPPGQAAWIYDMLGDLLKEQGSKAEALELYHKSLTLQAVRPRL